MDNEARRQRPRVEHSPQLNYARIRASQCKELPEGWVLVRETALVGRGITAFDVLAEEVMRLQVFAAAKMPVRESSNEAVAIEGGVLAGPGRVVERIDESLVQGIVLGTTEGNPHCGELRVELNFDESGSEVAATCQLLWRPGGFVLPGAVERERERQRKGLRRMLESLERAAA